jgi:hypothetical protein
VVFSHGWPLSADAWNDQMLFLGDHGYRCIAHDRRGHGRSSQPWNGNDMDTYADDLATLVETLDLQDAIHGDDDQIVPIGASALLSAVDRERTTQGLRGRLARHLLDPKGSGQRGSTRVLQGVGDPSATYGKRRKSCLTTLTTMLVRSAAKKDC